MNALAKCETEQRREQDFANNYLFQTRLNNYHSFPLIPSSSSSPCPACNRRLKSKGGFTKHMGSAHANYQGHFSSQFVYSTNKIDGDGDYDYGYDYADNNDSSTDNDNNAPSPSHVASSVFPLPPVRPASPDTTYIKHS